MKPELKVHSYSDKESLSPSSLVELTNWLLSTPTLQVSELEAKIKRFHYVECGDHQRLELLDRVRPLITSTAYAVRAAIAEGKLPLPNHVLKHIDGLGRIYAIISDLYKATILSLAAKILKNDDESLKQRQQLHEDLVLACYGAINYLSEQLRARYEGYRPASEGVWHEIHHIYNYARFIIDLSANSGVNEEKMRDEFFLIEHVYKRSLLLGLCNPYHFSVNAFGELNRTLNKWAHLCKLEHNLEATEKTCMFSVDKNSDIPAVPILSGSDDLAASDRYYVLNTKRLVAGLNQEIDVMAKQAFKNPHKNASGRYLKQIEMLRLLKMNWGKHPVRRDVRQDTQGICESIAGYKEIMDNMGSMLVTALKKKPLDTKSSCTIKDASQMGYQIEASGEAHSHYRIGEMIAVRDETHLDKWALAVVRWARYTVNKDIRLGMFIMGAQAERHSLQYDLSSDRVIDVMSVYGASNFPSKKKILLIPTGTYRPGKVMELISDKSQRIVAGNLIMSGADFDVIDYKVAS